MIWGTLPDWLMAGFAAATAYYAYQNEKTYKRLTWLVGALESHSTKNLQLKAKAAGVKVIAYDPTDSRFPRRVPLVGDEWTLEQLYLAIPPELRRGAARS